MKIAFVKMNKDAKTPTMATDGSAAYDLFADVSKEIPMGRSVIPTGIAIELPRGVRGRRKTKKRLFAQGIL